MDRKNRVRTKPVDRGMLKALCRYIDKFWRPESEPLEEAPRAEAALTLELPQIQESLQESEKARAKSRADSEPQGKGKPIVFGPVGAGLFFKYGRTAAKTGGNMLAKASAHDS